MDLVNKFRFDPYLRKFKKTIIMRIVLIGSGNVATHLGQALFAAGNEILQVYSRTLDNAILLSEGLDAVGINQIKQLDLTADLYVLSVKDDALEGVIEEFPPVKGIVCHTAGSISIDVLSRFNRYGVFYPFQTFSKSKPVDFRKIPMLIEACDNNTLQQLNSVAKSISGHLSTVSSEQRKQIHIAAVFACNFVNHMYRLSSDLLTEKGLSLDIIKPLIKETAEKVMTIHPSQTQTGPAVRNDRQIMQKHLEMLSDQESLQSIYKMMSESIIVYHSK